LSDSLAALVSHLIQPARCHPTKWKSVLLPEFSQQRGTQFLFLVYFFNCFRRSFVF